MEFVNQNSLKLTGYSPRELINNSRVSFVNLVHPDDRQMIRDAIQAAVKDKRPYQLAYRIQAAGGEKKWVWEQGEAVYDEHGNVLALEGFITDVTDQKNTEQALRESEERFRSTLDNMLEGCQILDHDWRYVYLNDAADVHNRRPKQELLGNRYMDMWSGIEDTEVFRKIKDVLEKRTPHHIENEFVFPDGTIGWFDLSIQPVLEGVFILSVDITDRKHAEQQLQAAVQQWGTTFNTMRDGVALLDADRRIVRCNQSLCDLTGMSVEELTGQVCCEVILGREKPLPDCPVNRSAKSKQREVLEMQIGDRWLFLIADPILDENQQVVGFVHLVADTTDRMRAEEQVKYQAYLLSNVNDAVMATDENYMLTSWNRTAQNMYGWTEEEVLGKNGEDLLQPDFLDTTSEEIEKQLRTEGSILAEAIQSRKDGSKIPVEIRMNALYDESGKMNGYVSVNRDITERKQTEDEIRQYIKRIEAMLEVSQAVSSTLDLKKVLDNILSKISQIIQCDSMSVLLFQDDMMEVLACRGFEQPDQVVGLRFAIDPKLPSYDVMKKRKPVAVADIAHDYPDFQILVNQDDYKKIGS
jgi:PAS domain S-box-containing protein